MRSSEEMAHAIYSAAMKYQGLEPLDWDELSEEAQEMYKKCVNAALEYLFEHGRISSYLNQKQLAKFGEEYRAYLASKGA